MTTPAHFVRGKFEVAAPYSLVANVSYTCTAVRAFQDLQAAGVDVAKLYYENMGLSREVYEADRAAGVSLVTLSAEEHPQVILPSSYIVSAPLTKSDGFNRMVIGVDIGIIPDHLDISYLGTEIAALVSDVTGLTGEVKFFTTPYTGLLSAEQAEAFEQNRLAAVANRATIYAKNKQLEEELAKVTAIKDRYEQIIIEKGLLST